MSGVTAGFTASGYDPYEWFFGSRYRQGGRTVYALDFSVREVVTFLPKPDASRPLDLDSTQRRIYPSHAQAFAEYVLAEERWVSPALLLRGPDIFTWELAPVEINTESTQFGRLGIPKDSRSEIQIVDGQHRTLGFHLAWEKLATKIDAARSKLADAKEAGQPVVEKDAQLALDDLIGQREKLANERVSVQLLVIESKNDARRIFVDINDNAKGITGSVKARFDDRKVLTRALTLVLGTESFIEGLVDIEQDRITQNSEYLLGAKHVADILRALQVGNGRIGTNVEKLLDENQMANEFDEWAEGMVEAFPILGELENRNVTPVDLREQSLLGSNVTLRGFAAAWWDLKQQGWDAKKITEAFAKMEPYLGPVFNDPKDTWFATGLFQPSEGKGATAPNSKAQDLRTLSKFIVEAAKKPPAWHRATRDARVSRTR